MSENKIYLGDGAYAEFDGYGYKLTTEDGVSVQNVIFLEPDALNELVEWAKKKAKGE